MSIEYQTSGYIYPYRFGNQSPLPVGWPAPLPPASLAADPSTTLLYLTWTGPCDGVSIKGGSIIVTRQSDGEVFCLKLRHGRFPPADTGRLAFEAKGFDGAQQLYNIEVKIELDQSSDHVMDDKASSFVGKFRPISIDKLLLTFGPHQPLSSRTGHKMSASTSPVVVVVCGQMKQVLSRFPPTSMPSSHRSALRMRPNPNPKRRRRRNLPH